MGEQYLSSLIISSGGSRMGTKGGLNSKHIEILRLINTNLIDKSDLGLV